ncbi:MAG: ABC transporter permease [Bacteroidetes bacterium]|nr:ABC transporter permease [Bacteroidota bacterium]
MSVLQFLQEYDTSLLIALAEHVRMIAIALAIATLAGVPLGVWGTRNSRAGGIVLAFANVIQTIPSIALFGLMIPVLALVNRGIGTFPAIIALVLYALLPIVRNTMVSLLGIPHATVDAARGLGMTEGEIFRHVMLPLALPGIVSGIRIAATMSVGVAAVAAFIGAGGMGHFILRGIQTTWPMMTIAGAVGNALLALIVELLLEWVERALTPRGVRIAAERPA